MNLKCCSIPLFVGACVACSDDVKNTDMNTPPGTVGEGSVARTDVVSDQPGAITTDPMLVNAWGLAFNPRGAAWVNAAESGVSAVYDATGKPVIPAVRIPAEAGEDTSAPTGTVFNADANAFMGDTFVFVTEGGTISGWQESNGAQAVQRVDGSGDNAVYKGVTIAKDAGRSQLYAADFAGAKIDVFDDAYAEVMGSGFADPDIPAGFAPFNVEAVRNGLVVTYAKQDDEKEDDVKGAGNGYVDMFDAHGTLIARLASQGELNSPWGVTLAPSSFSAAPDRLLIGNFGDGRIHAYDLVVSESGASAHLATALADATTGEPIAIEGLWALKFGMDSGGFKSDELYFTAGPGDETHGRFGVLQAQSASGPPADGGIATGGTYRIP